ncbi:hypothetical protein [Rhodoferax sp.]|uniref:hypothetical protein n=1 Tax=Rhodoferax sp. TaxID=50421 RepID=UPI00271C64F7|nr:hypothetical protein [Rhodoferax sp.]MDO9199652.1 hypothetical protein [Rhodoferax sp.]
MFSLKCLIPGLCVFLLLGCKPNYPPNARPTLYTTISADGQMVATLFNAGTEKQRLRVMRLDRADGWQDVQAPQFTQSIRFGLLGHELLLTHHLQEEKQDRLVKLDLDKQDSSPQTIYQDDELGFPVEVSKGQVMVRTCPSKSSPGAHQCRMSGYRWKLIGPGKIISQVGPDSIGGWPAPNIVGTGFFWIEEQTGGSKDAHPLVMSYPFPGGYSPPFFRENLDKNTWTVDCDRQASRCLRRYISNLEKTGGGAFVYEVEVLFGAERCKLEGVAGTGDGVSITPDGRAAVMSLAEAYDKPRHVAVMRFDPNRCQAASVQHIEI